MDIKNFRNEYAELVCSYGNLNDVGDDLGHSPLKKRYNALLDNTSRKMKYMQFAFFRQFPKKMADFMKTVVLLGDSERFANVVLLMKEFPELCEGIEMNLLDFILYLWKKENELFAQNADKILACFSIRQVCSYLYINLDFYPDMGLVIGDLWKQEVDESLKNEICLLMWVVSAEVERPTPRQVDFLKLFE